METNEREQAALKCPTCGNPESKVVDTWHVRDITKRRRECEECGKRYTTREVLDAA